MPKIGIDILTSANLPLRSLQTFFIHRYSVKIFLFSFDGLVLLAGLHHLPDRGYEEQGDQEHQVLSAGAAQDRQLQKQVSQYSHL
jgi:hypothetical protein